MTCVLDSRRGLLGGLCLGLTLACGFGLNSEERKPDISFFDVDTLITGLADPMEVDIAEDGRIFVAERAGAVKLYDPSLGMTSTLLQLDVECRIDPPGPKGGNWAREDGLLGLALDPNFDQNQWLYLYYSVAGEEEIVRLSRFTVSGASIDRASEIVMLAVPSDRGGNTCHMGGSLQFDKAGNLFITLGDNTNPFESNGFAPIDERDGRHFTDAQRTSANTADLRGKILRITPQEDGTYTIPDGNLFPPGTPDTRPEIYVMGNRNPFRLSIDHQTGTIYWGEVGPDSRESGARGPKGHDELNQAKGPGNFGWPYFIGNNKRYSDYDFETQEIGGFYDPFKPLNLAPRNRGLRELPPAQPAFIWYPYVQSMEFPELGEGGRNAMAGPVYRYTAKAGHFPRYYDSGLFMYDWMRGKVWFVRLGADEEFAGIEPFMKDISHPVDLEMGPDGAMYLLDYGTEWYYNTGGSLKRIKWNGWNRRPNVAITADKRIGKTPATIRFSSEGTEDPDGDALTYSWDFGLGSAQKSPLPNPVVTFNFPGVFKVALTVTDSQGKSSTETLDLYLGNAQPVVALNLAGDENTFRWGDEIAFRVSVTDEEDQLTRGGEIEGDRVRVEARYYPNGLASMASVEKEAVFGDLNPALPGAQAIKRYNCFACHQVSAKSIGPAYIEVARKYKDTTAADALLASKIVQGGVGVWGHTPMPAQPHISSADAESMVSAIMDLTRRKTMTVYGLSGSIKIPNRDALEATDQGVFVLEASYTDNGIPGIGAMTGRDQVVLRRK